MNRTLGWFACVYSFLTLLFSTIIGTRERHLESILQSSLSQIILIKNFPRTLIQIVLQIEQTPENDYVNTKLVQASLVSEFIPSLAHSLAGCLPNTHHPR